MTLNVDVFDPRVASTAEAVRKVLEVAASCGALGDLSTAHLTFIVSSPGEGRMHCVLQSTAPEERVRDILSVAHTECTFGQPTAAAS